MTSPNPTSSPVSGNTGEGRGLDPRWTAETEELAARAEFDWDQSDGEMRDGHEPITWEQGLESTKRYYVTRARFGLLALANAGLLLPPGGKEREERFATDERDGNGPWRKVTRVRRRIAWPDGSLLTGPWQEVNHDHP